MFYILTDLDDHRVYFTGPRGADSRPWGGLRTTADPDLRDLYTVAEQVGRCAAASARACPEDDEQAVLKARGMVRALGLDGPTQDVAAQDVAALRTLAILHPFTPTPSQIRVALMAIRASLDVGQALADADGFARLTPSQVHACVRAALAEDRRQAHTWAD